VTEIELATLAGFFAGEGTMSISGGKSPSLYVGIGNTEKLWIDRFQAAFPAGYYVEAPNHYPGAKFMFRWRATGKKALNFLRTIQPYLIGEKADQLAIAVAFQELKKSNANGGYTPEERLQMDRLRNSLKESRRTAAETNRKDAITLAK
jgi:hypothetical protein